jgi:hypothetical protein
LLEKLRGALNSALTLLRDLKGYKEKARRKSTPQLAEGPEGLRGY